MKYRIFLTAIIFLTGTIHSDPAFMIGFGGSVTTITGSDSLVHSSALRLGWEAKIGFEQNFNDHFSILIGAGLESRGEQNTSYKNLTEAIRQEIIEQIKIMSLQIPILAQFNLTFSIFRLSAFGGPDVGIILNGKKYREKKAYIPETGDQPARVDATKDTLDFSRDIKMLDLGVRAGVAFEINTGDVGAVFLRPSVYIGLIDILQTNRGAESNANLNGKHQAFSAAIGYKFNIRKKTPNTPASEPSEETFSPFPEKNAESFNPDQYRTYTPDSSQEKSSSEYNDSGSDDE